MPDLFHNFQIKAPLNKVFEQVATSAGMANWWSEQSSGPTVLGETIHLHFGKEYHWTAMITKLVPDNRFELTITKADPDWMGSKIGFRLRKQEETTNVEFYHTGWKEDNEHYRISNYCWAMYLRLLKRYLEFGEFVQYEDRLEV